MGQSTGTAITTSQGQFTSVRDVMNGKIVQQTTGVMHFLKEYSYSNQEEYQKAYLQFTKKLPEKHSHILFLQKTNTQLENTFCSSFFKISLLFEYYQHTLQQEILQRSQQNKSFQQMEVWTLLCACSLALSQMIRLEGKAHSAIKPKDIRLTQEGIVKILALEMVGMESDHDLSIEGQPKDLALTMMNCLSLQQISNDTQEYLIDLIETLSASNQLKAILREMISGNISFIDLQEYFMKLGQSESESLNSYSHTPIVKENSKSANSYSKIAQESKEDDSVYPSPRDIQDNSDKTVHEPITQEEQIPDQQQNAQEDKYKSQDDGVLKDSNTSRRYKQSNQSSRVVMKESNSSQKDSRCSQVPKYDAKEQSLFTDPKLLNLIHSDLQQIKKRKSVANSRKLGLSQSSKILQQKQMNIKSQNIASLGALLENKNNKEDQILREEKKNVQKTPKQTKQTNPEEKRVQKRYENIMQNQQMGFKKKNKQVKFKEQANQESKKEKEKQKVVNLPLQNSKVNTSVYNSNVNNSNHQLQTNINPPQKPNRVLQTKMEYVCQTYIRGRYEGTKAKCMREGKGVFYYNQGGKYIGDWHQNKMHGKGVLYYPNNEIAYDGEWKEDRLSGQGTLYNEEVSLLQVPFDYSNWEGVEDYWVKYQGSFSNDSKSGKGKLFLSNGQMLDGLFKQDMVWGQGILFRKDGSQLRGLWRQNKLVRLF